MAGHELLRELIQSMTAVEQVYFRRQAAVHALHGRNRYLDLFDALAAGQPSPTGLGASLATYLQEIVLTALRQFHSGANAEMESRALLDAVEICFEKGQFKLAERLVRKGLRLAADIGDPAAALALLKWQRRLSRRMGAPARAFIELERQETQAMRQLADELQAVQRHDRWFAAARSGAAPPENLGFEGVGEEGAFDAAIAATTGRGIAARHAGNLAAELEFFRLNLEVWHRFPRRIADHPRRYTAALINYLRAGHGQDQFEGHTAVLARIQALPFTDLSHKVEIQRKCLNLVLVQCLNDGDLAAAAPMAMELVSLEKDKKKTPLGPGTWYNLALFHFLAGCPKPARQQIGRILDGRRSTASASTRDAAMLLEVLIFIDLGEEALAAARVRSRLRMRGRLDLPAWQTVFYQQMALLLKPLARPRRGTLFRQAALRLDKTPGPHGMAFVEVQLWLQAKVQGCSLTAVVQQKKGFPSS